MLARTAQLTALAALAVHVAHTGFGLGRGVLDGLVEGWLYTALMLGAALGCLARGVLVRADRAAWLLLGAGALAWSAGDLIYAVAYAEDPAPPFPSPSDALYLAWYPLCAARWPSSRASTSATSASASASTPSPARWRPARSPPPCSTTPSPSRSRATSSPC